MKLSRMIGQGALVLGLYGLLATAVIASVYLGTKDRIELQQRLARERALAEIVPPQRHDNDLLADTLSVRDWQWLGQQTDSELYRARLQGEITELIIPVTSSAGFSGDIQLIVGIDRQAQLRGVRVLSHNETPGLGDKIERRKSDWILQFDGKSLKNTSAKQWAVKKDGGVFDQFTGATITPRAVVKAVYNSLRYFEHNRSALLAVPSTVNNAATAGDSKHES